MPALVKHVRENIGFDLPASIVVFLVALPLCMGIAIASGAPPATGLITGIVGGVVVGAVSGSPLQVSGPAAGLTVIVWDLIQRYGIGMMGTCVLVAGLLQAVAGLLGGGRWFRAISPAVVYGMLAGIGVLIFASQFHVMVDDTPRGSGLENLLSIPEAVRKGIFPSEDTAHHIAALLGVFTIFVIVVWSWLGPKRLRFVPAPLVAVLLSTGLAAVLGAPVKYVAIPDNLLSATVFPSQDTLLRLLELDVIGVTVALAVVASAETLLCAAAVDRMQDKVKTDYDRELTAQGIGNTLCGIFGGLPMTGVIVRSSANVEAGARTRMSAMLHGIWLLVLVVIFPTVLRYIPTSGLAAILVFTGYKLVNPAHIRELRQYGKSSVIIYGATMASIVATDLLKGVLVGVGLSLLRLLYRLTHLEVEVVEDDAGGRCRVHLRGAATFLRLPKLLRALERLPAGTDIHVQAESLGFIDHASLQALRDWERVYRERGGTVTLDWSRLEKRSERSLSRKGPRKAASTESRSG